MDARGAQPRFDLRRIGSAVQMQFAGQVAAPAGVGAEEQPRKLAKLRLAPLQVEMHRHLAQLRPRCCRLASNRTMPVSARSRLTSVRAGWPRSRTRQSPGFSCQNERSALTSENGSFSAPLLKLMRELVASR